MLMRFYARITNNHHARRHPMRYHACFFRRTKDSYRLMLTNGPTSEWATIAGTLPAVQWRLTIDFTEN